MGTHGIWEPKDSGGAELVPAHGSSKEPANNRQTQLAYYLDHHRRDLCLVPPGPPPALFFGPASITPALSRAQQGPIQRTIVTIPQKLDRCPQHFE